MNKDQVKGRVEEAKGTVKEATGRVTGNGNLEDRGALEKLGGRVRADYGDVKQNLKDSAKEQSKRP